MKGLHQQQGASALGIFFAIVAIVILGKLAYATLPAYFEDRTLDSTINSKLESAGDANGDQVMKQIQDQLQLNFSKLNTSDVLTVKSSAPHSIVFVKDYEVRHNLISNVDVVMHFQKEFRQSK